MFFLGFIAEIQSIFLFLFKPLFSTVCLRVLPFAVFLLVSGLFCRAKRVNEGENMSFWCKGAAIGRCVRRGCTWRGTAHSRHAKGGTAPRFFFGRLSLGFGLFLG
ncbi:hypothetical protein ES332_A08G052000v1 [Gossypium tomentosum]|uniref:Uncharacterized protein n=1 Tax=Gossypium tomentosum TaxID=34277 RepID=A0A5D2PB23_GOSTO|nr:hypothetical protein ES332_A08G052000v1 [Gossypium tomentosum]